MEILGAMGKGGGGGHTPTEANDTLRGRQNIKLLFAVNDGEIDNVLDVFLNKVSISQYAGASWEVRKGTIDQLPIAGFDEIETPTAGFSPAEIRIETPYTAEVNYNVTAIRFIMQLPQLRSITSQGDLVGYSVSLDFYTKATVNASEIFYQTSTKTGKASSTYAWDVRVERPANAIPGQRWQVKIHRTTQNDPNSSYTSQTYVSGQTEIQHTNPVLTYPETALVAVIIRDAAVVGNNIQDIRFRVAGSLIFLPTNYIVSTRTYNETVPWNLSFKSVKEYSDNPVWHLYYTLRFRVKIPAADLDIVSFYEAAKYADEFISDGKGGAEPRYTIHQQWIYREATPIFLNYLLTLINGNFTYNDYGQLSLMYDRPGQAVTKLATNSNSSSFSYSSNDIDQRYSAANVTWNDPSKLGETDTPTVEDENLIARYSFKAVDIILAGCYSEAQAIRKGRWALWTSSISTELVTWSVLLAGLNYKLGELVRIQDSTNFGFQHQGRILSSSFLNGTVTLILDRELVFGAEVYTIYFLDPDAVTIVQKQLQQTNGTFNVVTFAGNTLPLDKSVFILETPTKKPYIAKVVSVTKEEDEYKITALRHSEDKYPYIEGTVTATPTPANFINPELLLVAAPTNVIVSENFSGSETLARSKLLVSWSWGAGAEKYKPIYTFLWRRDNQNWQRIEELHTTSYDITDPVPGQYEFAVYATNTISGLKSAITSVPYAYRTAAANSTLDPVIDAAIQGTTGLIFSTPDMILNIAYNTANDSKLDKLLDYIVEVWNTNGTIKYSTQVVKPDVNKNALFRLSFAENRTLFGSPQRQFQLKIYCRDLTLRLSTAKSVTVNNPAPAVASFILLAGLGQTVVRITADASDHDIAGYKVWTSTSSSFVKDITTEAYSGPDNAPNILGAQGQRYYYAVAAYDSFGESALNISGEQSTILLGASPDTFSKTGLTFSVSGGVISWTVGSIIRNGSVTYAINSGSAPWISGVLYVYFNPAISVTTLQTTTTLANAVSSGSYPLATYTGGAADTLKGGDGSAFFSGSQLLAGTVGASALITGTAVITQSAQLASAIINDAHINGTLSASKISVTDLSAFTSNMGTITAGVLHSSDGSFIIDLNNKYIAIL